MSHKSALVLAFAALGSLIVPREPLHSSRRPWDRPAPAIRRSAAFRSVPPILECSLTPVASEMPHVSRRSAPTPRRHRSPTDRSIRYRRRARASSRRLMRARHSGSSARITSSQEVRHRFAGEVAHRSARSRGFAAGVRARLTFSFPLHCMRADVWR
jgi:hypothetical protein